MLGLHSTSWPTRIISLILASQFVNVVSSTCSSFTLHNLVDVTLAGTTYHPAHTSVNLTNGYQAIDTDQLPAFCRLQLVIVTNSTEGSYTDTEVWLPDDWNGRFLTFGNGGLAGGVAVGDLGFIAVTQGFAGVSTNTGHNSTQVDGSWAGPGNDNGIIDFGWRALHLSVVTGKEVVKQYYGKPHKKAYYSGCSTGGRQGLKEAQLFPDEFDGIIVGSPANWMTHLQDWSIHLNLLVQPATSPRFINATVWADVIHPEVLAQCDALDGLRDGIISNPEICNFRPETLACRPGQDTATCLTAPQIDAVNHIFADYYETNQTYIFGTYYPGGEAAYSTALVGPDPFQLGRDWIRYFVVNDTEWDIDQYNTSLISIQDAINPGQANAITPNLTAYAGPEHNGKVLHYVGWADQLISPGNSLYYYEDVNVFTKTQTDWNLDDFYRLFTVPGMNHCQGGYGANAFGGIGQASSGMPPLSLSAEHNVLAAMVRWVEEDVAPSSLTAVYWNDNNVTSGVGFTRPLCQYPTSLRYIGGVETEASSFGCF